VVSKLEETITVQGVLQYSDDKPVPDEWLKFDPSDTANTDGNVSEKTYAEGRFSLKILKGLKGELSQSKEVIYQATFIQFTSEVFYDGRLKARGKNALQRLKAEGHHWMAPALGLCR
jgi:hypothetical protein